MDELPKIDTGVPVRKKGKGSNALGAAGRLVALQAERTKLEQVTIPRAYAALGRIALKNKSVISAFAKEVTVIQQLGSEVRRLAATTQSRTPAATLMDKAKEVAQSTATLAQSKTTEIRLFQALVDFGKKAYARRALLGSDTQESIAIARALSHQEDLKARIQQLGNVSQEGWLTPQRIVLLGAFVVVGGLVAAVRPRGTEGARQPSAHASPNKHPAKATSTARSPEYQQGFDQAATLGKARRTHFSTERGRQMIIAEIQENIRQVEGFLERETDYARKEWYAGALDGHKYAIKVIMAY